MRHQTHGAMARATTVVATTVLATIAFTAGAAMAADERSRAQADAEAEAGTYYTEPVMRYRDLGYARGVELQADPFTQMRVIVIEPAPWRGDQQFIDQGDRGLGNE
ncbi:hypothetical protein [Xanthobacter autotrophicus]|uniref:hypothetical protein n=1 Tax=Xanthobacter autotrophicus TaxID=280 RepID=UPI00372AA5E4